MISAILCQDYMYAQNLQKGLLQANLKTLIYKTDFSIKPSYEFLYHDGFFVLLKDPTIAHLQFCINLKNLISTKNITVLIETENIDVVNKFRDQLDSPIFISPFSYRYIAGLYLQKNPHLLDCCFVYEFNGVTVKLDHSKRRLYFGDDSFITLVNKEFMLVEFLLNHKGRIVSKCDLLEFVWGKSLLSSTGTVDVHVSRLRRKLKDHFNFDPIKTVHCAGYMFG